MTRKQYIDTKLTKIFSLNYNNSHEIFGETFTKYTHYFFQKLKWAECYAECYARNENHTSQDYIQVNKNKDKSS